MIRLVGKKLIIPRGDTGSFSIPTLSSFANSDVAVFTIIDAKTNTKIFTKECNESNGTLTVQFDHLETVNLPIGKYYWDIKYYKDPEYQEGVLFNGTQVDSYYAAYSLPICEIKQTGDLLLTSSESPKDTLSMEAFNILNAKINQLETKKVESLQGMAEETVTKINEIDSKTEDDIQELIAETREQLDRILAKGSDTLDTIPDDYTTLNNQLKQLQAKVATTNDIAEIIVALDKIKNDILNLSNKNNDLNSSMLDTNLQLAEILISINNIIYEINIKNNKNEQLDLAINIDANARAIEQLKQNKANYHDIVSLATEVDTKADYKEISNELKLTAKENEVAQLYVKTDILDNTVNNINNNLLNKLSKPVATGEIGQALGIDENNEINWINVTLPDTEALQQAINNWLSNHPTATSTVNDNSITIDKLTEDLRNTINTMAATTSNLINDDYEIKRHVNYWNTYKDKLMQYAAFFNGGDGIGFLFFTDPHDFAGNGSGTADPTDSRFNVDPEFMLQNLKYIRYIYQNSPAQYVLCGGDLTHSYYTPEQAVLYCGRAVNLYKGQIGNNFYLARGNHDANGDGAAYSGVHRFTPQEWSRIWFGKPEGYYTVDNYNTRLFVFDTGAQHTDLSSYDIQQVKWFANNLVNNTYQHLFGMLHILYDTNWPAETQQYNKPGDLIAEIADTFNRKGTITIDGQTFNFSNSQGTFHFFMAGHVHYDRNGYCHNIPVISTGTFAFSRGIDCCYADFDNHVLHIIRVTKDESYISSGFRRSGNFQIIPNNGYTVINN